MRVRPLLSFVFAALVVFACGSDDGPESGGGTRPRGVKNGDLCDPGATQKCVGPGACEGAQACNKEGSGYLDCDCGNGPTGKGGNGDGSGTGGSTTAGGGSATAGTGGTGGGTTGTGGAQSSGGTGGGTTPGSACDVGAPQTGCESCGTCSQGSVCKAEWQAATNDAGFGDYGICLLGCSSDTACIDECDKANPAAADKFNTFATCSVCKACPNTCVASGADGCKK